MMMMTIYKNNFHPHAPGGTSVLHIVHMYVCYTYAPSSECRRR